MGWWEFVARILANTCIDAMLHCVTVAFVVARSIAGIFRKRRRSRFPRSAPGLAT